MKNRRFPLKSIFYGGLVLLIVFWLLSNIGVIGTGFGRLMDVSSAFIYGFVLAFIINIPMSFLETRLVKKTKFNPFLSRTIAFFISLLGITAFMVLMILLVIPDMQDTFHGFLQTIPQQLAAVEDWINNFIENNPNLLEFINGLEIDWQSYIDQAISYIQSFIASFVTSIFSWLPTLINSIFDAVVAIIFAIYLLYSKESLVRHLKKINYGLLPVAWANYLVNFGSLVYRVFSAFVFGQAMTGLYTGIVLYFLMLLLGFPNALSISVVTAITSVIPFYGPIVGGLIGFLLIVVVDFTQGLWFLVLIIVVQQIEGNIIYPKVMGSSVGLPGIWVMVTVTLGGALFGLWGMFLSVPVFSVIYAFISQNINARLDRHNLAINEDTSQVKDFETNIEKR